MYVSVTGLKAKGFLAAISRQLRLIFNHSPIMSFKPYLAP
jgi:hypothetical protein